MKAAALRRRWGRISSGLEVGLAKNMLPLFWIRISGWERWRLAHVAGHMVRVAGGIGVDFGEIQIENAFEIL